MNILIIDDEDGLRWGLAKRIRIETYGVFEAAASHEALDIIGREEIHIVLLDLKLAHEDGYALLKDIKEKEPDASVIIITGYGTIQSAVACMKAGASNYLTKPINQDVLLNSLEREKQNIKLQTENVGLKQSIDDLVEREQIISPSKKLPEKASAVIEKVKDQNVNILIIGETGTGKEVTAKQLHFSGNYKNTPFVSVNCSALNDNLIESELFGHEKGAFTGAESRKRGRFEIVGNGTLFLDEIGDMSLALQSKLLRVLEERTFERVGGTQQLGMNCRVITATNKDLKHEVQEGRFRSDLYYRLNVVEIQLPALRERKEDIPSLVHHFIEQANREYDKNINTISKELMERIIRYPWPGNIRQLKNVITNAVLLSEDNTFRHLNIPDFEESPQDSGNNESFIDLKTYVEKHTTKIEKELVMKVLSEEDRNISSAASRLGISRKTLYKKMEMHGL